MYLCIMAAVSGLVFLLISIKKRSYRASGIYAWILLGSGCLGCLLALTDQSDRQLSETEIVRPEPGADDWQQEYELRVDELNIREPYDVVVQNRHLTGRELQDLFSQAIEELEQTFLGENESTDRITHSVVLPEQLLDGKVSVGWSFDSYDAVNLAGELQEEALTETGKLVTVTAVLEYENAEVEHRFPIHVYPAEKTKKEVFFQKLGQVFADKNKATDKLFVLPQELDGYQLHWKQAVNRQPYEILFLGLAAIIGVAVGKKEDDRKKQKERKEQLLAEYPQMLGQIALLIGAGMTVGQAWEKLVLNYESRGQRASVAAVRSQPVYEEMSITYHQIRDGIGERLAYEQFGERLQLSVYRRFSSLLIQNLRKGTAGLGRLLEKEMHAALDEQERMVKKRGEELQTKLLLPMMLMLALVVVIIMIPAMVSFRL